MQPLVYQCVSQLMHMTNVLICCSQGIFHCNFVICSMPYIIMHVSALILNDHRYACSLQFLSVCLAAHDQHPCMLFRIFSIVNFVICIYACKCCVHIIFNTQCFICCIYGSCQKAPPILYNIIVIMQYAVCAWVQETAKTSTRINTPCMHGKEFGLQCYPC